jgi:hypothetical protein
LIALPLRHMALPKGGALAVGAGLSVSRSLPIGVPDHWREWLGSFRIRALTDADCFLLATAPSTAPAILDGENEALSDAVHRFYFGLLLSAPFVAHGKGMKLSGAHREGGIDVRSAQDYDMVYEPAGCPNWPVQAVHFQEAARIAERLLVAQSLGAHHRMWRITHAFYAGLRSAEAGIRVHQFVRCIEGCILPETGKTRKQFRSRTPLFLAGAHDSEHVDLLGRLFDIRSSVEHLHGPMATVVGDTEEARLEVLFRSAYEAEAIARHCLRQVLLTNALWSHFLSDEALAAFWSLPAGERRALWGEPLDLAKVSATFDPERMRWSL